MAALKEELRREILEDIGKGQWIDQSHPDAVLGRNKHIQACRRLMKEGSPDAHCHDGRWLIRATAMDAEIARENRDLRDRGKLDTEPPPPMPLAKTEPEDETGIYERSLLARVRGVAQ